MASSFKRRAFRAAALILVVAVGFAAGVWWMRPRLVDEDVQSIVVTTIQREVPASFYVTGYLDLHTSVTVENTKYLFPDILDLNLGTTRATVRVPGRVSYGFDVSGLTAEDIRVGEDGVIEVRLPALSLYSVEPRMEEVEVETSVGWARLHGSSGQRVEQTALQHVRQAMRAQAQAHLSRSAQPRINTGAALRRLLAPPLEAAGIRAPRFRFHIGPDLVLTPEG